MIGYVKVNDTLVELATIAADVTIRIGRQDVVTTWAPSSCRITFYDAVVDPSTYVVGRKLEVFDTAMAYRFGGYITDATLTVASPTSGATLAVTAVGPSARLAYQAPTALRPEEGVRQRTLLTFYDTGLAAGGGPFGFTMQSPTSDDTRLVAAQTSLPGSFIAALQDNAANIRSLVYDAPNGSVAWQTLTYRPTMASVSALAAGSVGFAPGFQQSTQIINRARVAYATGEVVIDDTRSQSRFGVREASYTTQLVSAFDAALYAQDILARSKRPRWDMPAMTFVQTTPETRYGIGQFVTIPNLPAGSPSSTYYGVVEGWDDAYVRGEHRTTYYLSDPAVSGMALQWDDVPALAAYRWNTINASVVWDDALTLADIGA